MHAARILKEEIERDMALLGVNRLSELTPSLLRRVPHPA
jgi:L-lactate dehydrogenase (cytochrome)